MNSGGNNMAEESMSTNSGASLIVVTGTSGTRLAAGWINGILARSGVAHPTVKAVPIAPGVDCASMPVADLLVVTGLRSDELPPGM